MDLQLKQEAFFGTDERARRRPLERHYRAPGNQPPLPDVDCRVVVGGRSNAATDALEVVPVRPVPLINQSAARAFSACIARIDQDDWESFHLCLVRDEGSQLMESPVVQSCPLALLNLDPVANALKVFESDRAPAAFGVGDECFTNDVVRVFLEPGLLPGGLLQGALGGSRSNLLQGATALTLTAPDLLNSFPAVIRPVAISCDVDDAEIDAEYICRFDKGGLVEVADGGEIELATNEHQVDFALAMGQKRPLSLAADICDLLTSVRSPKRNDALGNEPQDAVIVRLGAIGAELSPRLLVEFVRVGNLRDATNSGLRRQPESLTDVVIDKFVQVVLPEDAQIPTLLGNIVARSITRTKRALQKLRLFGRRLQLQVDDKFHSSMEFAHTLGAPPWPERQGFRAGESR